MSSQKKCFINLNKNFFFFFEIRSQLLKHSWIQSSDPNAFKKIICFEEKAFSTSVPRDSTLCSSMAFMGMQRFCQFKQNALAIIFKNKLTNEVWWKRKLQKMCICLKIYLYKNKNVKKKTDDFFPSWICTKQVGRKL